MYSADRSAELQWNVWCFLLVDVVANVNDGEDCSVTHWGQRFFFLFLGGTETLSETSFAQTMSLLSFLLLSKLIAL